MTYFSHLPHTVFTSNNETSIVKNILVRSAFLSEHKPYTDLYTTYVVQDGQSPQTIALDVYGSVSYHWVVLMFNEIHDMYSQWPMQEYELYKYCISKYGDTDMYKIAYWVDFDGNIVGDYSEYYTGWIAPSQSDSNTSGVSFYDIEVGINDNKRQIKLLRPELLASFVTQFSDSLKS